jgi:hypothetical protein
MSFSRDFVKNIDPSEFLPESQAVIKEYICALCTGVIFEPVSDECGHVFCAGCLNKYLEKTKKCPLSNKTMDVSGVVAVQCLKNVIYKQMVYCKNKANGCEWTGPLSSLLDHKENHCVFEHVKCPNKDCTVSSPRDEILKHIQNCDFKEMECVNNCGIKINRTNADGHILTCPKQKISCPQSCGEMLERQGEQTHLKTCKNTLIDCPYRQYGCEGRMTFGSYADHDREECPRHMALFKEYTSKHINRLEDQILELKKSIDVVTTSPPARQHQPSQPANEKRKPGRPKKITTNNEGIELEESENDSPVKAKQSKEAENNEDEDVEMNDSETKEKSNPKRTARVKDTSKYMEDKYLDLNDFPSFEEMSESSFDKPKKKLKEMGGKSEANNDKLTGKKRGRGRPPKNANNTNKPRKEQYDSSSDDRDEVQPRRNGINKTAHKESTELLSIDKDHVPEGIEIDNDNTATLVSPVKNKHLFIFANTSISSQDFNWTISINKLAERGWMALGLCYKNAILRDNKFNKADPNAFIISTNSYSWNATNMEQNDKIIKFPKLATDSIVELAYSARDKSLTFKSNGETFVMTKVDASAKEMTPCLLFLNNAHDSASFL